ncbi:MAG: hypothetical protein J6C37_10705 [Roseburia sp.]|nr:hypothetical protein [Roseburia sp.]
MQKSIIVLPDGTELSSGRGTTNALMNVQYTELVNSEMELTPGSVCCSCMEATLIAPGGALSIAAGTEVTVYTEYDDTSREQVGIFRLEKPTRSSANAYKITAYDRVALLDADLTTWLTELKESFPMTLQEFVEAVCEKCGAELANSYISNGDLKIEYFSPGDVTGRKLLQWAAEIAASFVRATPEGLIEFAWYTKNTAIAIAPVQSETEEGIKQVSYFQGSLSYEDYEVMAVEKVQISSADDDVGVVWPSDLEEGNTYVVSSNMILSGSSTTDLQSVAQHLYQTLMGAPYVPCKVSVPRGSGIRAGNIITVTDANGVTFDTYVMQRTVSAGKETLECTGSQSRGSSTAVNNRSYKDLEGRMLRIQTSIDGIKTEVKDAEKNITALQQTAGTVSVTASSEQGTLKTVISNDGTWKSAYTDANGNELSGIEFDFTKQSFVFKGSGSFTGDLNIGNGKFVVDENGNMKSKGIAELYGAKILSADGDGVFLNMQDNGLALVSPEQFFDIIALFAPKGSDGSLYPKLLFNANVTDSGKQNIPCMIQQFADGMWVGNILASQYDNGNFKAIEGSVGIFISLTDGATYSVSGTNMTSFYTGDTIARFG